MCSWYQTHASGLIGSPTDPSSRSDERSCFARVLRPPLHVRADRGRRRVEDRHAVALDDLPPAVLVGEVGRALVHDRRGAVAERPVDDVAVAGDPADVGGAPVDVACRASGRRRSGASSRRRRGSRRSCARSPSASRSCPTCRAGRADPRRPSARAGSRVSSVASSCHQWSRPSVIGTSLPVRRRTTTLLTVGDVGDRLVGGPLQRHGRAAPPRLVLRDQHLAAHVVQPVGERVGREAAEDDGVRRAEPRAGEHRDRRLGDHAHVDRRPACPSRRRAP